MGDWYTRGNVNYLEVYDGCDLHYGVPLVALIDTLNKLRCEAPDSVRHTLTAELEDGYEGEFYFKVYREASTEEVEERRRALEESDKRYWAEREEKERREFERLSKKFGSAA